MSHEQTLNKKKLASLLDELKANLLDLNTHLPTTRSLHEIYRENMKVIVSLTKMIRLHSEFTNLFEPGKCHAHFLVKWEKIEYFAWKLGKEWYYFDGTWTARSELFRKEGREARMWCESIQDVRVKGEVKTQVKGEVKREIQEPPARECQ